jgi:hypothetical protein
MGYARFVERFESDASFSRWFDRLVVDIETMADPSPGCMDRLAVVNNLLLDLLEFLDPGGVRYPIFDHPDILDTAAAGLVDSWSPIVQGPELAVFDHHGDDLAAEGGRDGS